jgi:argininosuccinate lyase
MTKEGTFLWGGRFERKPDAETVAFSTSIGEDYRLYPFDILGSIAHCMMLERVGIISQQEREELCDGLRSIYRELQEGKIDFTPFEDIHSLVEHRLRELKGQVADKLHTARSRNDQIVLDERLYLREMIAVVIEKIITLQERILEQARAYPDLVMPGFTHFQPAQPVLYAYHMMAYFYMLERDIERFWDSLKRVNVLPLGAGALAGTSLPIDREYVASLLAFPKVQENGMDAVSDRDFILEFLFDLLSLFVHLSRLSEELVVWSSPLFGFIEMDEALTTGSSIMPQKKNPDLAELLRGKCGEFLGALVSLAATLKGLPLAYNRDLQQDKKPLFRSAEEALSSLDIAAKLVAGMRPLPQNMEQALKKGFLTATDLAEFLVEKGVPFRKAHHLVGRIVRKMLEEGRELTSLRAEDLGEYASLFEETLKERLDEQKSPLFKKSLGSTAPDEVRRQVVQAEINLEQWKKSLEKLKEEWKTSFEKLLFFRE